MYRRLRQPLDLQLPQADVLADIERLQGSLRQRGHLLGPQADGTPQQALDAALTAFASYHTEAAVTRVTGTGSDRALIAPGDRQLLYYYQNRIESLAVTAEVKP